VPKFQRDHLAGALSRLQIRVDQRLSISRKIYQMHRYCGTIRSDVRSRIELCCCR